MGLLDRTIGTLRSDKAGVATALVTPNGLAAFPNLRYDTFVREGYQKNELVFACIEIWSTDISEAQVRVVKGEGEETEEVKGHRAVELLNNPNPYLSGDDLLGGVEMYKKIAGNSYTLKVRSGARRVVELYPLRPDRVRIIPDSLGHVHHYDYKVGANSYDIDAADLIHHRTRNPYDDFYGMPPLMAASGRVDIDNFTRDMLKGTLENSGVPAGVLQIAGKMTEGEKSLLRRRFKTDFSGANAGNIVIADGGAEAPKYTPLGAPLGARGLVIPELDEISEARICMVFLVPQSLVGTRLGQGSSSYANRVSDREFFTEQGLVPEWKSLAATWTTGLEEMLDEGERLEYDLSSVRALGADYDALTTRIMAQMGVNKGVPVISMQEARLKLGWNEEPDDDDIFMMPLGVTPTPWKEVKNPPELEPMALPAQGQLPPGEEVPAPVPAQNGNGRVRA